MTPDTSIKLRPMLAGDIPAACELCRLAGWNQIETDWQIFLNTQSSGCFVAVCDEKIVATATAANYNNCVGWIGMVLVDPSMRRRGIATAMLERAIELLEPCNCIKLDATDAGRKVYEKLGFVDEYRIDRLVCDKFQYKPEFFEQHTNNNNIHISPMATPVLEEVIKLDTKIFGTSRGLLLSEIFNFNTTNCFTAHDIKNKLTGYSLARSGHNFTQLGPTCTTDSNPATAISLLQSQLEKLDHQPICVDTNEYQTKFAQLLKSCGFKTQRSFARMYLGKNTNPGQTLSQKSIIGPEHS